MRTLHRYLTRQVLLMLLMTVAVFTFVLLLTNLLKEVLSLLVNHQATLWILVQAIALLVPFVMAYALPMGMLTATLLVFGRFSADQELTAARASGISLISLITPVLILSAMLSLVCGWFNLDFAPRCRVAYKEMLFHLGFAQATEFLEADRFIDLPGWVLYARRKDGAHLHDVRLYQTDHDKIVKSITASDGQIQVDSAARTLSVSLTNATVVTLVTSTKPSASSDENSTNRPPVAEWFPTSMGEFTTDPPISLQPAEEAVRKPKLSDMSFRQLRTEIHELERQGIDATPAQVQLHRQVAFSFASLGFTLIGIPLGVRAHRRETTAGVALALVLVLVYYSFIILAQAWQTRPELAPQFIVWLPNFLFQAVGSVLLYRANRGI